MPLSGYRSAEVVGVKWSCSPLGMSADTDQLRAALSGSEQLPTDDDSRCRAARPQWSLGGAASADAGGGRRPRGRRRRHD